MCHVNNTTALADGDKIAMTSRTALGLVRHLDFEHGRGWLRDRVREAEQREAGAGACCDWGSGRYRERHACVDDQEEVPTKTSAH